MHRTVRLYNCLYFFPRVSFDKFGPLAPSPGWRAACLNSTLALWPPALVGALPVPALLWPFGPQPWLARCLSQFYFSPLAPRAGWPAARCALPAARPTCMWSPASTTRVLSPQRASGSSVSASIAWAASSSRMCVKKSDTHTHTCR